MPKAARALLDTRPMKFIRRNWEPIGLLILFAAGCTLMACTPAPVQGTPPSAPPSSVQVDAPQSMFEGAPAVTSPFNIEPSECTTSILGVTAQKNGEACLVRFDTKLHRQIIAIGGWCDSFALMESGTNGFIGIMLTPMNRWQGPDTYTFSTRGDHKQGLALNMKGVDLRDMNGTSPCSANYKA